jgi:hypothetical protein
MNALIRGSLNPPISIWLTQAIDHYLYLPGQYIHDHHDIDHLFMGEEVSFPLKLADII